MCPSGFHCHSSQISFCYSCVRRLGVHQQLWHQSAPEPGGQAVCSTDPGSKRAPVSRGCGRHEWCQRHKVRRSAWEALCAAGWQNCLQGEISAARQIPVLLFHLILFLLLLSNGVIRSNSSIVGVKVPVLSPLLLSRGKEQWKEQTTTSKPFGMEPG